MKKFNKIDKVEVYIVKLPLVKPFETSFGVQTHKEALLVKITSEGEAGWGECVASPEPFYSYETNETAFFVIKNFLFPIIRSKKQFTIYEILEAFKKIRGHNMAKATIENALMDLLSKKNSLPLYELMGGKSKKIMSGISIGIKKNFQELLDTIYQSVEKKYHRIKIKIKRGQDIEALKRIRQEFPYIRLMVDANSDYTINDIDTLKQFDDYKLMMVEQPLYYDDIYFHSILQKEMKTPICLDESIKNLNDVKVAINLGSCRIVNIKQGRVGGLSHSKSISEYCQKKKIKVWSGGMLETGIGRSFNIHMQTLPGFVLPGDTSETARYFKVDIVNQPVTLDKEGFISIPEGPGIGVTVSLEKLNKFKTFYEKWMTSSS